jgi:hypothetical protein
MVWDGWNLVPSLGDGVGFIFLDNLKFPFPGGLALGYLLGLALRKSMHWRRSYLAASTPLKAN